MARPALPRPGRDPRHTRPARGLVPPPRADLDLIGHATFVRARKVVGLSLLPHFFGARLAKTTGRPMEGGMNVEALLTAMLLAAVGNQPMHCAVFAKILHARLTDADRAALGLTGKRLKEIPPRASKNVKAARRAEWRAAYRQCERLLDRMLAPLDPSPNPSGRRLTHEQFAAAVKPMTAAEQADRHRVLDWAANRLLEATFLTLPLGVRQAWDGSLGHDATFIATHADGTDLDFDLHRAADGDAAWWGRSGDHKPEAGADLALTDRTGRRLFKFGYDAELAVMGSPDPSLARRFPFLVLGMTLHQPGFDPAGNAVTVLAGIAERHLLADPTTGEAWPDDLHPDGAGRLPHPAAWLATDRAYSDKPADAWALPARLLGYRPVFDYSKTHLGRQGTHQGAILVDGQWYSPGMPDDVRTCTQDRRYGRITQARLEQLLAERPRYALRPNGRPDPLTGTQRFRCPASGTPGTGTRPTASCDRKPDSLLPTRGDTLMPVFPTDEGLDDDGQPRPKPLSRLLPLSVSLPTVCDKQTISIKKDVLAHRRQELVYQSPEWKTTYGSLRNAVEGANGVLKSHAYQALEAGDRRRVLGLAAATFLSAFQIAAANLKQIATFYDTADWDDTPTGTMTVTTPRRTRTARKSGTVPGATRRTGRQRRDDTAKAIHKARKLAAAQAASDLTATPTTTTAGRDTGLDPLRDRPDDDPTTFHDDDPHDEGPGPYDEGPAIPPAGETPDQRRRRQAIADNSP